MTYQAATQDASRYDFVWGAGSVGHPHPLPSDWRAGSSSVVLSRYMVFALDYKPISGHNLAWWQANHPDMILYNCDDNGNPTKTPALEPGALPDDIGLDLENTAATDLEVSIIKNYMNSIGDFNALAIDQFITYPMYSGYNPSGDNGGQTGDSGYFGCGVYAGATPGNPFGGTFKKEYTSKTDSKWFTDAIAYVQRIKSDFGSGYKVVINHPAGSTSSANEQTLEKSVDGSLVEDGFTDYGKYPGNASFIKTELAWVLFTQQQGASAIVPQDFAAGTTGSLTADQIEWAIGTYLLANSGNEDTFISPDGSAQNSNGYGAEHYYTEYATVDSKLGTACAAYSIPDPTNNPDIYTRKFTGGYVAVNIGSGTGTSQKVTLPSHTYTDLEGKAVTNPLSIPSSTAFVMFTTAGTGCN